MTSSSPKILLTGATGYIGGSILSQLLSSPDSSKYGPIACLIRGKERQKVLTDKFRGKVNPVLFGDLDDSGRISEVASQYDIIINCFQGFHPSSSKSLVLGLAKRRQDTGKDTWIIHTSGTSNLADQPVTGKYLENREFSDKEDIFGYEKKRNALQPYGQRNAELTLIDTGLETGVKTLVIMSPNIYGPGTGEFNKVTPTVPSAIRDFISHGYGIKIGDGKGQWGHVHIADFTKLYQVILDKILLGGVDVPYGEKGIIFSETGRQSWAEFFQCVADAVFKAGKIQSNEVRTVGLQEGVDFFTFPRGNELLCELALASNSKTKAEVARELGWKPERGYKDWLAHFEDEVLAQGK